MIYESRIRTSEALEQAIPFSDAGRLAEAQALLQEASRTVSLSRVAEEPAAVALVAELQAATARLQCKRDYDSGGKAYVSFMTLSLCLFECHTG